MLEDIRPSSTEAIAGRAQVSRDMERIFGPAAPLSAEAGAKPADPLIAFTSGDVPRGRHWPLMLLAGALCATIAGGVAWATWLGDPAELTRPSTPPTSRQTVAAAPAARPATDELVIAHSLAGQAPSPAEATALPPVTPPAEADRRPKREARPLPIAQPDAGETRCDDAGGEAPASCHAAELALADQQLRLALARAASARMDPKLLTMFQKRWWQVRQDIETDPAYVTAAYRQLTREIDAARLNG
ncbi:MAG: hypothetical protein J7494_11800 [Sphingobium sp.]|nr:hypothetical protein [Sphingobium sp.]